MSEYTTQLRWIIQSKAGNPELPIDEQIKLAVPKIFDFDFPIWNEDERQFFCEYVLYRYFYSEIAAETYGMWHLWLRQKLFQIMPNYIDYYNMSKDVNFLEDVDLKTSSQTETKNHGENSGDSRTTRNETSNGNTTTSGKAHGAHFDYPQSGVGRGDYESYADTDTTEQKQNSTANGNSTSNYNYNGSTTDTGSATRTENKHGRSGGRSPGALLKELKEYHIIIVQDAAEELSDLFMIIL